METNMMIDSTEEAQAIIEKFNVIRKMAVPVAKAYGKLKGYSCTWFDEEDIKLDDWGNLTAKYEASYCCGETEYETAIIELEWLFDPTWLEKATAEIKKQEEEKAAAAEQLRIKRAQEKVEAERQEYLKLKAKFDPA